MNIFKHIVVLVLSISPVFYCVTVNMFDGDEISINPCASIWSFMFKHFLSSLGQDQWSGQLVIFSLCDSGYGLDGGCGDMWQATIHVPGQSFGQFSFPSLSLSPTVWAVVKMVYNVMDDGVSH